MAWLGTGLRGFPRPSPGVESLPVLPPPRANGGSSGHRRWEHHEEKGNARLPVSHGFRHRYSARGPQPRPAHSYSCPSPAPNPKFPPAGPPLEPTEVPESCVSVASVGAAEGSPFFPNLFLACGDSLQCSGLGEAVISCPSSGWNSGGSEPGRGPGFQGARTGRVSSWGWRGSLREGLPRSIRPSLTSQHPNIPSTGWVWRLGC